MPPRSRRAWDWIHTWSSLICTAFMLVVCITGLPLIFADEIAELTDRQVKQQSIPAGTQRATIDSVVAAAVAQVPGNVPLYLFTEGDHPDLWYVKLDSHVDTDESKAVLVAVDARDAHVLGIPDFNRGFMGIVFRLHVDLFAGLPGKVFLGLMGVLLLIAIVSGMVLYPAFMRKLDFGTVRHERSWLIRWLDLHNLFGAVTLCWALVVGATGVVNTWADLILSSWQQEQMTNLAAGRVQRVLDGVEYYGIDAQRESAAFALRRAMSAEPDMRLSMMAWPGTLLSTKEHFAIMLQGATPFTSHLKQALLVNPQSGEVLQAGTRPWYVTMLQLSIPLHFGDYGGFAMKLLWAAIDLMTIVVLVSGLYLWLSRRAHSAKPRLKL